MSLVESSDIDDPWRAAAADQPEAGGHASFSRSMRADVRLLAEVRAELRAWLAPHRIAVEDCDAIVLACSEAVANAIEHAYRGNAAGIVMITGRINASSVELSVHDRGEWIPADAAGGSEVRGRGLVLITQLMDAAAIDSRDGTTVLMRRSLTGRLPSSTHASSSRD